jgi:D-ornithine 4,5-aminomutase subunit alpha
MSSAPRADDFEVRRRHLRDLTDEQLHARFWELADQIVAPLVEEARTHTTPSIERSVLLRMGLSSLEAKELVDRFGALGLLGHGTGRLLLEVAGAHRVTPRDAAGHLLAGEWWQEVRHEARTR